MFQDSFKRFGGVKILTVGDSEVQYGLLAGFVNLGFPPAGAHLLQEMWPTDHPELYVSSAGEHDIVQ